MTRGPHARRHRRVRLLGLALLALALVGGAWSVHKFYTFRKQQNTQKLLAQARESASAGDWADAAVAYRQYLQREPGDTDALDGYADVLWERLKTAPEIAGDTIRTLRRLVGMRPDDTTAVGRLAQLYLSLREYSMAEELAAGWMTLAPRSADAALVLALSQQGLQKNRDAADTLIAAVGQNPDTPSKLYPLLVRLLAGELNEQNKAERWLEEALRLVPDSSDVQFAAFTFHQARGELETAERHLRAALELAPESLDLVLSAATYNLSRERWDEAHALLERASRIAPEHRRLASLRALWAAGTGTASTMVAAADELLAHTEDRDVTLLLQAAELYLRAGAIDRADECLDKVASIPNLDRQLMPTLNVLKGAGALFRGNAFSATAHLRRAVEQQPSMLWAVKLLAMAYLETGEFAASSDMCGRVLLIAPGDVDARLRLAELAWQRGRVAKVSAVIGTHPTDTDEQRRLIELIGLACALRQAKITDEPLARAEDLRQKLESYAAAASPDTNSTRWLMRSLVLAGMPDRAVEIFRRNLTDNPSGIRLGPELGALMLSEQFGDQALVFANELIGLFPEAAEGHVLRVKALASTGGLSEAAAFVRECALSGEARGHVLGAIGDAYLAAGQSEPAVEAFREAVDLLPRNVTVRRKLARRTSDLDEALRQTAQIRAVEGEAGWHWKYEHASATLRLSPSGEPLVHASELLEQCVADRPRQPSARLLLGYAYELRGQLNDAVEAYQVAIAQQPSLGAQQAGIRLIELLMQLGRFTEADTVLDTLATVAPDKPEVLRLRTQQQIRGHDYASALASAEHLLELRPDNPAWAAVTADLHIRAGDANRAETIARTTLARLPDSVPALWSLARVLTAQGRLDEAEAEVRQAALRTENASTYILLARVLAKLDRVAEADEAINHAQKIAPEDAAVWAACADFWGSRGQRQRQLACARKAIRMRGDDPSTSLILAGLSANSAAPEERAKANEIVQRYLAAHPDDPNALILEGRLAALADPPDFAKAEASFRRSLSINPRSSLTYRLLGSVLLRRQQPGAARDAVTSGIAYSPNDPELLLLSARIHLTLGDYGRAVEPLRHALELRPRTLPAFQQLAAAYRELGQADTAIRFIESQTPQDARTSDEILILASLYESIQDVGRAEELFRHALEMDDSSGPAFQAFLHFQSRRHSFDQIHELASNRRSKYPDDIESLAVAGEILGSACPDRRLSDAGIAWLEMIARSHPEYAAETLYRSARCYYARGELALAEKKFLEALQLAPDDSKIVNDLAWLHAEDLGRPADAAARIEQFLSAGGTETAHLLDTYGLALMRLGRLDAAAQKLTACMRIAGRTPTGTAATYHLGVVQMEAGRTHEGMTHVRQALALNERTGGLSPRDLEESRRLLAAHSPAPELTPARKQSN